MKVKEINELIMAMWRIRDIYNIAEEDKKDITTLCNLVADAMDYIAEDRPIEEA